MRPGAVWWRCASAACPDAQAGCAHFPPVPDAAFTGLGELLSEDADVGLAASTAPHPRSAGAHPYLPSAQIRMIVADTNAGPNPGMVTAALPVQRDVTAKLNDWSFKGDNLEGDVVYAADPVQNPLGKHVVSGRINSDRIFADIDQERYTDLERRGTDCKTRKSCDECISFTNTDTSRCFWCSPKQGKKKPICTSHPDHSGGSGIGKLFSFVKSEKCPSKEWYVMKGDGASFKNPGKVDEASFYSQNHEVYNKQCPAKQLLAAQMAGQKGAAAPGDLMADRSGAIYELGLEKGSSQLAAYDYFQEAARGS